MVTLFLDLNTGYTGGISLLKSIKVAAHTVCTFFGKYILYLLREKPQAQNGVTCAKAHDTKPRLNT